MHKKFIVVSALAALISMSSIIASAAEEVKVPCGEYSIINNLSPYCASVSSDDLNDNLIKWYFPGINSNNISYIDTKYTTAGDAKDSVKEESLDSDDELEKALAYLKDKMIVTDRVTAAVNDVSDTDSYTFEKVKLPTYNLDSDVLGESGEESSPADGTDYYMNLGSSSALISRSDLYMALCKIYYGVDLSNPVSFHYKIADKTVGDVTYTYPEGGYALYYSTNVYENYLLKLAKKGLIKHGTFEAKTIAAGTGEETTIELSKSYKKFVNGSYEPWYPYTRDAEFISYLDNTIKSNRDKWLSPLKVSYSYDDSDLLLSEKILGKSANVKNGTVNEYYVSVNAKNYNESNYAIIQYFKDESLTMMDALRIIEDLVRANEKVISSAESEAIVDKINYLYEASVLEGLSEEERSTVQFLIAKGILNCENEVERGQLNDLTRSFTWGDAWLLLYRVCNPDARLDFSSVTLTADQEFWMNKGYVQDTVEMNVVSNPANIQVDSIFRTVDGVVKTPITKAEKETLLDESFDEDMIDELTYVSDSDANGQIGVLEDLRKELIEKVQKENEESQTGEIITWFRKTKHWVARVFGDNTEKYFASGESSYTIKTTLVKGDGLLGNTYTYKKKKIKPGETNNELTEVVEDANTGDLQCTFEIKASSKNAAMALLQKNLSVKYSNSTTSKCMGVTQLTSNTGEQMTLIAKDSIVDLLPEIKILSDNTLRNTETGATVTMLGKQESTNGKSIAFSGNKVIVCDDMFVTDNNGQLFYNLKVICPILSNASLQRIGGQTTLAFTSVDVDNGEKLCNVVNSDNTLMEKNYCIQVEQLKMLNGNETDTFYNFDSMSRGINALERTWDNVTMGTGENNKTFSITVIVRWEYQIPLSVQSTPILYAEDKSEDLTQESATRFMTQCPSDATLAAFWKRNVAMSNALANMMYSTQDKTYVYCGWMVPNVTILATAGDEDYEGENVNKPKVAKIYREKGSLNDDHLNEFFRRNLRIPKSDWNVIGLQGGIEKWWKSYYIERRNKVSSESSDSGEDLMEEHHFRSYLGVKLGNVSDDSSLYYAFGAKEGSNGNYEQAVYLLTHAGVVYAGMSYDSKVNLEGAFDNGAKVVVATKFTPEVKDPEDGADVIATGDDGKEYSLKYKGTTAHGNSTFHQLDVVSVKDNDSEKSLLQNLYFKGDVKNNGDLHDIKQYVNEKETNLLSQSSLFQQTIFLAKNTAATMDDPGAFSNAEEYYSDSNKNVAFLKVAKDPAASAGAYVTLNLAQGNTKKATKLSEIANLYNKKDNAGILGNMTILLATSNHCFTTGKIAGTYTLGYGDMAQVLNSGIYFTGLNNVVRDLLLLQSADAVPVSSLKKGDLLYVNNKALVASGSSIFGRIECNTEKANKIATTYLNHKNKASCNAIKTLLLEDYKGYIITGGGRQMSFSTYLKDIELAKLDVPFEEKNSSQAAISNESDKLKLNYSTKKGKFKSVKLNAANKAKYTPSAYGVKMTIADGLYCRQLDDNVYELITVTDVYANGGLSSVPFICTSPLEYNDEKDELEFGRSKFLVNSFTKELRDEFLKDCEELTANTLTAMLRRFLITLLLCLVITSWIAFFCHHNQIMIGALKSIALSESNVGNKKPVKGVDILKIITLGICDVNTPPKLHKLFILTLVFTVIAELLFRGIM